VTRPIVPIKQGAAGQPVHLVRDLVGQELDIQERRHVPQEVSLTSIRPISTDSNIHRYVGDDESKLPGSIDRSPVDPARQPAKLIGEP
jgi:hypothetical protein